MKFVKWKFNFTFDVIFIKTNFLAKMFVNRLILLNSNFFNTLKAFYRFM